MRQASPSAGAPWGTRSGDGRHRPRTTRAIVRGIGPSRPDRAPRGVRETVPAFPDHGRDPCVPDAARTRWTRTPNTVRDVRLSMSSGNRTHSRSVSRNGTAAIHVPSARRSTPPTAHRPDRTLPGSRKHTAPGSHSGTEDGRDSSPRLRITHGDRRALTQVRRRPLGFPFRAGGRAVEIEAAPTTAHAKPTGRAWPAPRRRGPLPRGRDDDRGDPGRSGLPEGGREPVLPWDPLGARRHPPVPVTSYAPSPSPSPRPGRRRNGPCCRRRRPRPGRPGSR